MEATDKKTIYLHFCLFGYGAK